MHMFPRKNKQASRGGNNKGVCSQIRHRDKISVVKKTPIVCCCSKIIMVVSWCVLHWCRPKANAKCARKDFDERYVRMGGVYHSITQRQPAVLSPSPRSRAPDLPFVASSSSTMSCGRTVIWTTLAESEFNLHSVEGGCVCQL